MLFSLKDNFQCLYALKLCLLDLSPLRRLQAVSLIPQSAIIKIFCITLSFENLTLFDVLCVWVCVGCVFWGCLVCLWCVWGVWGCVCDKCLANHMKNDPLDPSLVFMR